MAASTASPLIFQPITDAMCPMNAKCATPDSNELMASKSDSTWSIETFTPSSLLRKFARRDGSLSVPLEVSEVWKAILTSSREIVISSPSSSST